MPDPVPVTLPAPFAEGAWLRFRVTVHDSGGNYHPAGALFRFSQAKFRASANQLWLYGRWPSGAPLAIELFARPQGLAQLAERFEAAGPPAPPAAAPLPDSITGLDLDATLACIHSLLAVSDFDRAEEAMNDLTPRLGDFLPSAAWRLECAGHAATQRRAAHWYYRQSLDLYSTYASWSTGSGEGIERMRDVRRLEALCSAFAADPDASIRSK